MRIALFACTLFTNCITAALHEAAFPEGTEYDYALDASTAESVDGGFRVCFQGPDGKTQVVLTRVSGLAPLHAVPLSAANASGGVAWTGIVTAGCTVTGLPGQILPAGSLLFENEAAVLQETRRASVSTTALSSSARVLSAEISADRKHLRLGTPSGPVILRKAAAGEYEPEFMAYMEDQWIRENKPVQADWERVDLLDQKFLGIYYMHPTGSLRLKVFALPGLQKTEMAYVPHLAERPEPNRYYLIPLYPLAAIVDVLTVALQLTIWYDEGVRTAECLRW